MIPFIKRIIPKSFRSSIYKYMIEPFTKKYKQSYAQCGEDVILDIILNKPKGFYIDIGANNPIQQSNTMYFYKKGWSGINIDATPGSMSSFNRLRKRDINLEVAIANEDKEMLYYLFEPSFYNSFEKRFSEQYKDKLIGQKLIKSTKLSVILEKYIGDIDIDFITIDAEGYDYDILISNNWNKYRPKVVVVEYITYLQSELEHITKMKAFLQSVGYNLFCNSPTNAFFVEKNFLIKRFGSEFHDNIT